jgi:hypothetical protein
MMGDGLRFDESIAASVISDARAFAFIQTCAIDLSLSCRKRSDAHEANRSEVFRGGKKERAQRSANNARTSKRNGRAVYLTIRLARAKSRDRNGLSAAPPYRAMRSSALGDKSNSVAPP